MEDFNYLDINSDIIKPYSFYMSSLNEPISSLMKALSIRLFKTLIHIPLKSMAQLTLMGSGSGQRWIKAQTLQNCT